MQVRHDPAVAWANAAGMSEMANPVIIEPMKLASWNVNSLRVRLSQVQDWIAFHQPDALALQETKITDADFPRADFEAAGFHPIFCGQRSYNGVAILSRQPAGECLTEPVPGNDPQRRVVAATIGDIRLINLYVPNGSEVGSEKYAYKLDWLAKITDFIGAELERYPKLVVVGDFNIAPEDRDVYDPLAWHEQILCSTPERAAFRRLLALGLIDTFRLFEQPEKSFTWWDYRAAGFRRNLGLRLDHILASVPLSRSCLSCRVDVAPRKLERPSDHAPVVAEFEDG
jgi:exodeoxyribonuclease-3